MEQVHSTLDQIQSLLRALGGMGVAGTIIIGVLAGIAATLLMPGDDPSGFIVTPLVGIAGSVLATWLGQYVHLTVAGEWSGFIAAVVGSMLILLAFRIVFRKRG
ncbi:MAG TPA: GlsB/YeaQ/YmgE family stress response membrane protein [Nitrospiria bacterium]|nr:GlsB/YeaQ/YmgE family stress response membrane protein [Nitrospiria bacterium]